jgi:hypothetical protein
MGYMHGGAPHWPISLVAYIFNLFELYFHVALCSVFQSAVVLGICAHLKRSPSKYQDILNILMQQKPTDKVFCLMEIQLFCCWKCAFQVL